MANAEQRARILVVDDDARVAQTITRILSRDYEVTAVDRAVAALELLTRRVPFDVILCDVQMPGIRGEQFYGRLERELPEICTKLVFLTAGAVTAEEQAALDGAGCPCIEKPFSVEGLRQLVASMLD